jgi:hypothetical protein
MRKRHSGKESWDSDLETVVRRWPYVPGHAKRTLVELVGHYGPKASGIRYPTPPGADWPDVEIVVSGSEARITVGNVTQTYTYAGLGLADKRNRKRARSEWRMLCTYAENPDPGAYNRLPYRDNLKVEIFRFRRWLQKFFGIPGDPLKPFESDRWRPRFKIREL